MFEIKLRLAKGFRPTAWDIVGSLVAVVEIATIMFASRNL